MKRLCKRLFFVVLCFEVALQIQTKGYPPRIFLSDTLCMDLFQLIVFRIRFCKDPILFPALGPNIPFAIEKIDL